MEATVLANVYYHGSNSKFEKFDQINNKTYQEFDVPSWFFTKNIEYAKSYGDFLYIVKLNIKNTFDTSNPKHYKIFIDQLKEWNNNESDIDNILDEQFYNGIPYWTCGDAFYTAKSHGFDSILIQEELASEILSVAVFNPDDIEILKIENIGKQKLKENGEELAENHVYDKILKLDAEYEQQVEELGRNFDEDVLNVVKKHGGVDPSISIQEFKDLRRPQLWDDIKEKIGEEAYNQMRAEIPSVKDLNQKRYDMMQSYFAKKNEIEKEHTDPYAMKGDLNSPYIYHYTTVDYMKDILNDNTLYDYGGEGTGISTTTNPNLHKRGFVFWHPSEYSKGKHHENVPIIFVLDFNKIKADGYKIKTGNEEAGTHQGEEEIQIRTDELPNLNKYLVKFIFYTKAFENEDEKKMVVNLAKEHNVPFEFV